MTSTSDQINKAKRVSKQLQEGKITKEEAFAKLNPPIEDKSGDHSNVASSSSALDSAVHSGGDREAYPPVTRESAPPVTREVAVPVGHVTIDTSDDDDSAKAKAVKKDDSAKASSSSTAVKKDDGAKMSVKKSDGGK